MLIGIHQISLPSDAPINYVVPFSSLWRELVRTADLLHSVRRDLRRRQTREVGGEELQRKTTRDNPDRSARLPVGAREAWRLRAAPEIGCARFYVS